MRTRIAIGLVGFSLATSLLFGFGAYWAADVMELLVLEQNIGERARRAASVIESGKTPQLPDEDWYYARFQSDGDIEREFSQLQNGSHHDVIVDGREFHLWIEPISGDRLFLFFDLAIIEAYELQLEIFLVSIGVILGVFAFGVGMWLTPWIARPVTALANRVKALPRDAHRLSQPDGEDPDLTVLAEAIDSYLTENHDLVERERAFTGMASHELRNPVSTTLAALDVIEQKRCDADIEQPLERIRRATLRMSSLIDVLLDLARQQKQLDSDAATCRPAALVREIVEERISQHAGQKRFKLDLDDYLSVSARPAMFQVVASNLITNAVTHSEGPVIEIRVDRHGFVVSSEGSDEPAAPENGGLGLTIVDVISARCGWTFIYEVKSGCTTASVSWD